MAHYDCSNCGESMGIAWGSCSTCTPLLYLKDKEKLPLIYAEISSKVTRELGEEHHKRIMKYLDNNLEYQSLKALMAQIESERSKNG